MPEYMAIARRRLVQGLKYAFLSGLTFGIAIGFFLEKGINV